MAKRSCEKGAVSLEFMLLFPVIIAILYAAAVYGITFFAKYQMQDAVDRAVASALYVDRSAYPASEGAGGPTVTDKVIERAQNMLGEMVDSLPASWKGKASESVCEVEEIVSAKIDVVTCSLSYPDFSENPIVPSLNFGWLGKFPPLPESLEVSARAAF